MAVLRSHLYSRSAVVLLLFLGRVLAGSVTEGNPCSPLHDKIDSSTHKFISDCDDRTFCSPSLPNVNTTIDSNPASLPKPNSTRSNYSANITGTCTKRFCRKDEFPFGFTSGSETLPSLCPHGFFCPDNGSGCRQLLQVGETCDMNRDYQCAPSSRRWESLTSEWNHNGSICLKSTCTYSNVTIGLACILEQTSYKGYNREKAHYSLTISRDNCISSWPKLYCNPTTQVCEKMKDLGVSCASDRECISGYCNSFMNACSEPPGKPVNVKPWQYALTIMSILGAVIAICVFLALSHKRQRMEKYYDVLEYYHEQTSLRASIISLHAAAARRLTGGNVKLHHL